MAKVTVDGNEIEVEPGTTILQACEQAGREIPRFCYHERLSIAGNCRMCLVEVERSPKPVASCAMPVADGMVVHTNTPGVKKAREGVMEFLLINHPLDCPICDQGGECDLQDQAVAYGHGDFHRYDENKRAVEDKDMGPLIKTIMTRCIHCTRCVRFITEVAGASEIGATGRGEDMEITTYLEKAVDSEMSGNVIDLCPVGALTSKPYAFTARPWELRRTETIDAMDAVGANIRVDTRGREVMRIMPRLHEDVNEEWLSDRSRFVWDGLRTGRLDRPYLREGSKHRSAGWAEAFAAIAARLDGRAPERVAAIAGDMACAESLFAAKTLFESLGVANIDCRQDSTRLAPEPRQAYLFNTTIAGIEDADALLLIGTNPRSEAPVLNARFRKRSLMGGFPAAYIGPAVEHTFRADHLGTGPDTLQALVDGSHPFAEVLRNAERPMLVLGQGALARADGWEVLALAARLAEKSGMLLPASGETPGWNGFNVLHTAAARVGGLDLGFLPQEGGRDIQGILEGCRTGEVDTVFLLGADEIAEADLGSAFVIYMGHHGDRGAHRADVILPGAAYTEKSATYVNTEGRVQVGRRSAFPPGEAREDWAILRALSEQMGKTLPFDTLEALRQAMREAAPVFNGVDYAPGADGVSADLFSGLTMGSRGLEAAPFTYAQSDHYKSNPVARASATMRECAALFDPNAALKPVAAE